MESCFRHMYRRFPGGSGVKTLCVNAGDAGLIPGSGRSTEEGNSSTLQYSCLANPMDRVSWWATVHRIAKEWDKFSRLNNNN